MLSEFDPHKLLVEGKLWYDLFIAILTGVGTGLFVEFLSRRREESRLRPAQSFMRSELMTILHFLFDVMIPRRSRKSKVERTVRFDNGAFGLNPPELRDPTALKFGSDANGALSEEIFESFRGAGSEEPDEVKALPEVKRRLEEFLGRNGPIIEPELRVLVSRVLERLWVASEVLANVRGDWSGGEAKNLAEAINVVLVAAEPVRLNLNNHVKGRAGP